MSARAMATDEGADRSSRRRGIAIASAIYLLLILTGLVLVSLADAGESHRASLREEHHSRALSGAERAIATALTAWDAAEMDRLLVSESGPEVVSLFTEPPWPLSARSRTTRLADRLFWVAAHGSSGSGADRSDRWVALLVEHAFPSPGDGAIVVEGELTVGSGFIISLDDDEECVVTGWTPVVAVPAARVEFLGDSIAVRRTGSARAAEIERAVSPAGQPATVPAVEIPAGSVVSLPFAAPGSDSATSRAPFVLARGDLTITGGSGSALLVVTGRLHIEGGARLRGVVMALGGLTIDHPGAVATGAIVVPPVSSALLKEGSVLGSPCVASAALRSLARPVPVGRRGWFELW